MSDSTSSEPKSQVESPTSVCTAESPDNETITTSNHADETQTISEEQGISKVSPVSEKVGRWIEVLYFLKNGRAWYPGVVAQVCGNCNRSCVVFTNGYVEWMPFPAPYVREPVGDLSDKDKAKAKKLVKLAEKRGRLKDCSHRDPNVMGVNITQEIEQKNNSKPNESNFQVSNSPAPTALTSKMTPQTCDEGSSRAEAEKSETVSNPGDLPSLKRRKLNQDLLIVKDEPIEDIVAREQHIPEESTSTNCTPDKKTPNVATNIEKGSRETHSSEKSQQENASPHSEQESIIPHPSGPGDEVGNASNEESGEVGSLSQPQLDELRIWRTDAARIDLLIRNLAVSGLKRRMNTLAEEFETQLASRQSAVIELQRALERLVSFVRDDGKVPEHLKKAQEAAEKEWESLNSLNEKASRIRNTEIAAKKVEDTLQQLREHAKNLTTSLEALGSLE